MADAGWMDWGDKIWSLESKEFAFNLTCDVEALMYFTQRHNMIIFAFLKGLSHFKSRFCPSLAYREYLHDWLFSICGELGSSRSCPGTCPPTALAAAASDSVPLCGPPWELGFQDGPTKAWMEFEGAEAGRVVRRLLW